MDIKYFYLHFNYARHNKCYIFINFCVSEILSSNNDN